MLFFSFLFLRQVGTEPAICLVSSPLFFVSLSFLPSFLFFLLSPRAYHIEGDIVAGSDPRRFCFFFPFFSPPLSARGNFKPRNRAFFFFSRSQAKIKQQHANPSFPLWNRAVKRGRKMGEMMLPFPFPSHGDRSLLRH